MAYDRRHNYVNTSDGSPIRIGTDKYKVLEFIYSGGSNGVRYTDIVKFIVETLRGWRYTRLRRGYWGTNLLGSYGFPGILGTYCEKKKVRPAILDNEEAQDAYARRVNARGAYGLTNRQDILSLEYMKAKDKYENGRTGNWILTDEKLKMHFGGGSDGMNKRLEILRHARLNLGLPNLNFQHG